MTTFHDLATGQQGHIDRKQLLGIGMTDDEIELLVEKKHWQRPHPGVYRTGSAPPVWEDRVRAATMAAGASRAMGRTAARLHGLDGSDHFHLIELTVPMNCNPVAEGVIVHHTRRIDAALTTTIRGIPVSCVNQTLLECAWLIRPDLPIERLIEDAFRRKDTDEGPLRRFLGQCGKGVNGVTHLRAVVDKRLDGRPARSGFEVIVGDILRQFGIVPLPTRRTLVAGPHDEKFEIDLSYFRRKIAIEPMGKKWHSTPSQRAEDARRRRILEALGWLIIPVTWEQAIFRPWEIAAAVQAALQSRP